MTTQVVPIEHCPNCKTHAPCLVTVPPPKLHSGYECTNCGETRWGGITRPNGGRVIGYRFSVCGTICWRCADATTPPGTGRSMLPYLKGYIEALYHLKEKGNTYNFDQMCDECGVLIDENC